MTENIDQKADIVIEAVEVSEGDYAVVVAIKGLSTEADALKVGQRLFDYFKEMQANG